MVSLDDCNSNDSGTELGQTNASIAESQRYIQLSHCAIADLEARRSGFGGAESSPNSQDESVTADIPATADNQDDDEDIDEEVDVEKTKEGIWNLLTG